MHIASLLRGFLLTSRYMGIGIAFKEFIRRVFGINYAYRGILVNSNNIFRLIRNSLLKGYNVYRLNSEVVVQTPFGEVGVDSADIDLLGVLMEPLEEMYSCADVRDGVIIDVGAYIGETSLLFISRGAKRVYALEPVKRHYQNLIKNIARNNLEDKIIPLNYGAWFRDTISSINYSGTATGLRVNGSRQVTVKLKDSGDILKTIFDREGRIDLVKMDCEGCEYSLLKLDKETIKLSRQYIIEIHGSETPILDKMTDCGYNVKLIKRVDQWVTVYYFTRNLNLAT